MRIQRSRREFDSRENVLVSVEERYERMQLERRIENVLVQMVVQMEEDEGQQLERRERTC